MRKEFIGVGWLSVGSRRKYTVNFPFDKEGRCRHIYIFEDQVSVLEIKRHPNMKKVSDFLNSKSGIKYLNEHYGFNIDTEIKACWSCKYQKSKKKCSGCKDESNHVFSWTIKQE